MNRKTKSAMKKLVKTGRLTTDLLEPLGIPFEAFLRLALLEPTRADALVARHVEQCRARLAAGAALVRAEKTLAAGDLDEAFELTLALDQDAP